MRFRCWAKWFIAFNGHDFGSTRTGAPQLHPWWKLQGEWPRSYSPASGIAMTLLKSRLANSLASRLHLSVGDTLNFDPNAIGRMPSPTISRRFRPWMQVVGIVSAGGDVDDQILMTLNDAQLRTLRDSCKRRCYSGWPVTRRGECADTAGGCVCAAGSGVAFAEGSGCLVLPAVCELDCVSDS